MKKLVFILLFLINLARYAHTRTVFVSPTGSAIPDGTRENPYNLACVIVVIVAARACLHILRRDAVQILQGEREQRIVFFQGGYILDDLAEISVDSAVEMVLESEIPGMAVLQGNLRGQFLRAGGGELW